MAKQTMSKQEMRAETERLVKEAMERKAVSVKQGDTRIEAICGKCGAPNRVSAPQGQTRVEFKCKECGHFRKRRCDGRTPSSLREACDTRRSHLRPPLSPCAAGTGTEFTPRAFSPVHHKRQDTMVDSSKIKEHMDVIGADSVHVGTVDKVEGKRIKLTKKDSGEGAHKGHHHYIELGLVADIEGQKVRLSANAAVAVTLEEEKSSKPV